jgi:NADH-quinone oxidoreductase subunit B
MPDGSAGPIDVPSPRLGAPIESSPRPVRVLLDRGRRYELAVVEVGLACCSVEVMSALRGQPGSAAPDTAGADEPGVAHVLVVSGTCTDVLAPAVRRLYDAMPEPRHVMAFGVCTASGGPYWDSYSVTKGIDQIVPVDVYVPGCPPRPEALLDGLRMLDDRLRLADPGEGERP